MALFAFEAVVRDFLDAGDTAVFCVDVGRVLLAYVCWRAFEEEEVAGGEGVLEEEGSWGGSLAPRVIEAGVGDVADLRESEERLEVERVGIRVGGAGCCCCRDDG